MQMTTATARQLVPDDIRERYAAARPAVLQERDHSAAGGPPELLEKLAAAQAAFDEWDRPRRELAAARAALKQWHDAATQEFCAWHLAEIIRPVVGPMSAQLQRLNDALLATQDQRPLEETAAKSKAYIACKRKLDKLHEDPPAAEDLDEAIASILSEVPPAVDAFSDWRKPKKGK
jgi:hypothetical protein